MKISEFFREVKADCPLPAHLEYQLSWLFRHIFDSDPYQWPGIDLTEEKRVEALEKVERLKNGEPILLLLGSTEFYGTTIKVSRDALIPRPETEWLAKMVATSAPKNGSVLDVCTGSGCIALSIKKNRPDLTVSASDLSPAALELAKTNAEINNLELNFIFSNMFEKIEGQFDCIVSNPPYIKKDDMKNLPESVRVFDPWMALYGGEDGLFFYRILAGLGHKFLKENGTLFLEIGEDQGEQVSALLKESFVDVVVKKDLFDNERYVIARRK